MIILCMRKRENKKETSIITAITCFHDSRGKSKPVVFRVGDSSTSGPLGNFFLRGGGLGSFEGSTVPETSESGAGPLGRLPKDSEGEWDLVRMRWEN